MEIRPLRETDSRLEVSRIYEESWKFAYQGIVPQSYLDGIPAGRWADVLDRAGWDTLVLTVGERLAALDPGNGETYRANAGGYALELEELDRDFAAFLDGRTDRTIVFGDRFPLLYFAGA